MYELKTAIFVLMIIQIVNVYTTCDQDLITFKIITKEAQIEILHNTSAISTEQEAFTIEVEDNLKVLCKGALNITKGTINFYIFKKNLQQIESGAFYGQNIKKLKIFHNSVSVIKGNTFENMPIVDLDLFDNKIETIEAEAFKNLPNLKYLNLGRNRISKLSSSYFSTLPELRFFHLNSNLLEGLKKTDLIFLKNKRKVGLNLSDNKINHLDQDVFNGIDLISLDLSRNQLEKLEDHIFNKKDSLEKIILNNNYLIAIPELIGLRKLRIVNCLNNNLTCEAVGQLEKLNKSVVLFNETC